MKTVTVTAKGQIKLSKELLDYLGIEPGQKLAIEKLPGGKLHLRAQRKAGTISDLFGMLKRPGQPRLSIKGINNVIADGWAGKR